MAAQPTGIENSHFTPEGIGQGAYERSRSLEPGTLLRPYATNRELAQVTLSIRHVALAPSVARIAIQTSVERALEVENIQRALLPESARPKQSSAEERVAFAVEYVDMLQGKLHLTDAQRQTALFLTPTQLDTVDALLQVVQLEQPTALIRNGRNVPSMLVTLIQQFLDNPPSDEILQLTQSMYGEGLVFLTRGLSIDQIRELLLTQDGSPTEYARDITRHLREYQSFILAITPEGAHVYRREVDDRRTIGANYPVHDWKDNVLPLPEAFAERFSTNVSRLRR